MLGLFRIQCPCTSLIRVAARPLNAHSAYRGFWRGHSRPDITSISSFFGSAAPALAEDMRASREDATPSLQALLERLGPVSSEPMVPPSKPVVIIISGPSGVGKDAVIKALQQSRPDLAFVVTATSRPLRPGEVDGVDYFFVSKQQFEAWLDQGELLEHALVYGDYKGIPRSQVQRALDRGTDVVLRIDVQGADTVRKLIPEAISIFLVAETEAELVQRLVARKTEPLDKMLARVQTARSECEHIQKFDYVVVNREGRLAATVDSISAVIEAEKCRVQRRGFNV